MTAADAADEADATRDADAAPVPTGSAAFQIHLPNIGRAGFTVNVYDVETGAFVGGIWKETLEADADTPAFEVRSVDDGSCVTDERAALPEGRYDAFFALETSSSIRVNSPLGA